MSFFSWVTWRTWLFKVSDRAEKSCENAVVSMEPLCRQADVQKPASLSGSMTYLGGSFAAIMVGYTNLVEQAMQLANDGVHLL